MCERAAKVEERRRQWWKREREVGTVKPVTNEGRAGSAAELLLTWRLTKRATKLLHGPRKLYAYKLRHIPRK